MRGKTKDDGSRTQEPRMSGRFQDVGQDPACWVEPSMSGRTHDVGVEPRMWDSIQYVGRNEGVEPEFMSGRTQDEGVEPMMYMYVGVFVPIILG